jgi:hypothetical protein
MAISLINASSTGQTGTLALTTSGTPVADMWYVNSQFSLTADVETFLTSNLVQLNVAGSGVIGSMSQSSGVFTFPQTGLYRVGFQTNFYSNSATARYIASSIKVSTDGGSTYSTITQSYCSIEAIVASSNTFTNGFTEIQVNVTNTSNIKIKFSVASTASNVNFYAGAGQLLNGMIFTRLGNSV